MGRASGRKNLPRTPAIEPGSPDGREIGLSARQDPAGSPIPGLTGNIVNYETTRQEVPAPEPFDEFRGIMAHGVPHEEHSTEERATATRGGPNVASRATAPIHGEPHEPPLAVPVYIVESQGGPQVFRTASPRHLTVPNTANDPVRLCGRNLHRVRIGLLNEGTAPNIRFAQRPSDLVNSGGALLSGSLSSFSWFMTQDELFATTDSASLTASLSVIEEFEQEL